MTDYKIVDGCEKHIDALERLERHCFSVPWTRAQLISQLPDENHDFIVMEADGEAIAYVGMMYVLDEGYISNVAVSPAYRRQGIADKLISQLLKSAEDKELSFVTLEVRQSNMPAIRLYEKNGFIKVGQRKNYYDLPKEDAILMTKFLKCEAL